MLAPRSLLNRFLTVCVLGVLTSLLVQHDYTVQYRMGKEAFLAKEAARFDRFITPHSSIGHSVAMFVTFLFGTILLWMVFELISWLISLAEPSPRTPFSAAARL